MVNVQARLPRPRRRTSGGDAAGSPQAGDCGGQGSV